MTELRYQLSEQDFLTYQLFVASNSKSSRTSRRRARVVIPILYTVFAVILLLMSFVVLAIVMAATAVLWFLLYPLYSRRRYRRHYARHIREHYRQVIGRESTLTIADGHILTRNEAGEGRTKLAEVEGIVEIADHVLIVLRSSATFVLPKQQIDDAQLREVLRVISEATELPVQQRLDWKWR